MAAMSIRPAVAADETTVVALWRACELVIPANDPEEDFRLARNGPASDVLVGVREDAVVATVMVGSDGHRGWLYYVAVDPRHRRLGLGRAMVRAAEEWLASRGVAKVQLLVRETNAAVAAFYERMSFAVMPRIVLSRRLG